MSFQIFKFEAELCISSIWKQLQILA